MKTKQFLFFLIFASLSVAAEAPGARIRSAVFDVEARLSKGLEEQISQFVGVDGVWVATHLSVSLDGIEAELKAREDHPEAAKNEKRYADLPGLLLPEDGAAVQSDDEKIVIKEERAVDSALILSNTRALKVTVYHKGQLEKKVERVVRSLIEEKLTSLNVELDVKFDRRKARALENADLKADQKVRLTQDPMKSTQAFLETHVLAPFKIGASAFFVIAAALFIAGFTAVFLSIRSLNKGLASLAQAMANREPVSAAAPVERAQERGPSDEAASSGSEEGLFRTKILELYAHHREVASNFFADAMEKKNFREVWCLSQVLGERLFVENEGLVQSPHYRQYQSYLKDNLFEAPNDQDYQRLYQKLMGLMLYPEVYFLNGLRKQLETVELSVLTELFKQLDKKEKSVLADVLEPLRLAALVNSGSLRTEDIVFAPQNTDLQFLRRLDGKVALHTAAWTSEEERALDVLLMLQQSMFDAFIREHRLPEKFLVENLFDSQTEVVRDFFRALAVEDICALLPMLSADLEEELLPMLPEIKLARVEQAQRAEGPKSPLLLKRFYRVLLSHGLHAELSRELAKSKAASKLKAVA